MAKNPRTPIDILRKLAKDEEWKVRSAVAQRLNKPLNLIDILSKNKFPKQALQKLYGILAEYRASKRNAKLRRLGCHEKCC